MISYGLIWSADAVDPLWHDTEVGYTNWVVNSMSNEYPTTFSR